MKTAVAKKKVPNTPVATTKEPRFSEEFVRASIIAINGLDTPRQDELLHNLQNIADLEKDRKLGSSEELGYLQIALVSVYVDDTKKVFLDRVKQIVTSRSVSMGYAMDLARDEPEYKAVLRQRFGCAEALKLQLHDGHLDGPDICGDLKPITAYKQSVLCHISQDECGSP